MDRGRIPKGLFQNYDPQPQQGLFRRGGTGLAGLFGMEPWYNQDPFDIAMGFTGSVTPMAKAITRHVPLGTSQASRALQKHLFETGQMGKRGWHGSGALFDEFDDAFIGTGEGAQAFSRGHYFGEAKGTGETYRDALTNRITVDGKTILSNNTRHGTTGSRMVDDLLIMHHGDIDKAIAKVKEMIKGSPSRGGRPEWGKDLARLQDLKARNAVDAEITGHLYEVGLNVDDAVMLHWDKPLSEPSMKNALKKFWQEERLPGDPTKLNGEGVFGSMMAQYMGAGMTRDAARRAASSDLRYLGFKGVKYLDQGSRAPGKNELTYNHVIFDPKDTQILKKSAIGASPLASEEPVGK